MDLCILQESAPVRQSADESIVLRKIVINKYL